VPELNSTEIFFPTLVWRFSVDTPKSDRLNGQLIGLLQQWCPQALDLGPGEALQTDPFLHEVPDLRPLIEEFEDATLTVLDFLDVVHQEIRITGCWANINGIGTAHQEHIHPNNFLSGVYYVQADEGADSFKIHDPRPQRHMIRPEVREATPFNGGEFSLSVKPGDILVFPSWLPHSVDRNRSGRPRISVSFNAIFRNFSEVLSRPQWQGQIKTGPGVPKV